MDPNYRGGDSNELSPETRGPDGEVREPSGGTPATPSDSILGSYNEETSPAEEAEKPRAANDAPNSPAGSDDGRVESSSSSYLTVSEDKEAKKMLPSAKTPARKASDIRKENLEKKLAAQAAKKDGVIPRSLQKQIRQRLSVEEPALKVPKTASTDRATTGGKSIKTPGGSNTEKALEATPIRTATGPSASGSQKASQKAFSPSVSGADNSPHWLDAAQYARAMLKAVPRDEKEAIPGINSFNADRVMVNLADALLRVEGLKKAYIRKLEEVRRAKHSVDDAHSVAHYSMIVHDLETKAIIMQHADQVKSLQRALSEQKLKLDNLQAALDNAEDELKKHE
ncbi:uncharacterized protein LOC110689955 [Chenopodium quinoa]|uniref:uncharacterized protein LOC110689955 n=1 Tax=Chenopodium quinoa TaxID=63459 RepID=UPI000B7898DD|nr:uncharacterized protein LOC110689955 [Chenopodium quinoa]